MKLCPYLPQTHVISKDAGDAVLVKTSHPGNALELVVLQFSPRNELRLSKDSRVIFIKCQFNLLPSRCRLCLLAFTFAFPGTGSIIRIRVILSYLKLALALQSQLHSLLQQLGVGCGFLEQKFQASPAIDVILCFLGRLLGAGIRLGVLVSHLLPCFLVIGR